MTMKRHIPAILLAAALSCGPALLSAQQTDNDTARHDSASQDMHNAGQDTKNATHDAAQGTKKGTQKAYHKTKRGTQKAYNKTKNTTKGAVEGGKEGAKQPQ